MRVLLLDIWCLVSTYEDDVCPCLMFVHVQYNEDREYVVGEGKRNQTDLKFQEIISNEQPMRQGPANTAIKPGPLHYQFKSYFDKK